MAPRLKWLRWPLIAVGAVAVVILGYFGYVFLALGHDMCGATVVDRLVSPDSAREAVIYEYNCGATTSFSGNVGIGSPGLDPLKTDVVYSIQGQPVRLETGAYGGPINALFRVRWTGPREVEIRYPADAVVHTKADRAAGVSLTYVIDR